MALSPGLLTSSQLMALAVNRASYLGVIEFNPFWLKVLQEYELQATTCSNVKYALSS